MTEKLKPCPFCGKRGEITLVTDGDCRLIGAYAECGNCEFQLPEEPDEPTAVAAWNRRAPDPS